MPAPTTLRLWLDVGPWSYTKCLGPFTVSRLQVWAGLISWSLCNDVLGLPFKHLRTLSPSTTRGRSENTRPDSGAYAGGRVTGFAPMSPAHKPRDPRCPLSPGVFGQEGVCAGELSELLKAVSGPRASGGTASSRQAGPADYQRVPAWENRAETPGIGETPDPGSRGQCDLSKAAGSGKVLPDSSSFPQCQAGKALCVCDAGGN